MYFSISFGKDPDIRNTWKDWGMIPDTPPMIPPPDPNLNLVSIPGSNTTIDLSKYPTGKITYQRITGRNTIIRLEEDPHHYYKGILTVSTISTGNGPNQISIGYNLEPMRYNVSDDSRDTSWVSDWTS